MALNVLVDGRSITAAPTQNLLAAGLGAQLAIPYFCWHPAMGAVGACRQCAVKVFHGPADMKGQIVMACMTKPTDGMRVSVDDPEAVAFRAGVIELVLTNHPHDCPVCEVGGECHLQDMTVLTGHHQRRYNFPKRTHLNQNLGPLIRHEMNRCIGCYRCVRFYRDYAGGDDFGVFGAHRNIYFGRAADGALESAFSGNLVEVCPTGVFVDKPFSAKFRRKWDLRATPSICPHCAVGCNITIHERAGQFRRVMNRYNDTLNGYFLCDRGRFGAGFVDSPARLLQSRDHAGRTLAPAAARARLASILAEGGVIGIGSARASVESNFALRSLVGASNFYAGLSTFDAAALATSLHIMQHLRPATLAQIERADAFLLLGDDPALIAPRLALALRQAARQADHAGAARRAAPGALHPFMTAMAGASWLDSVTRRVNAGPSHEFAQGLIDEIDSNAPRGTTTSLLLSATAPVIVAGGDAALCAIAANLVLALRRQGVHAQLCLLLPEANSIGLGLLDHRDLASAARAASGRHVIILERDILREPAQGARIFAAANAVTVLDSVATPSTARADMAIAVASFAESDGIFVNLEGRVQPFFKAILAEEQAPASWRILRDAAIEARRLAAAEWQTHHALLAAMAGAIPALAPCQSVWPHAEATRPATLPDRHSGRTAATATVDVAERLPPQHDDSPLGATMEGEATAQPWSPGWNSAQPAPRASAPGLTLPDIFLFEDAGAGEFGIPAAAPPDDRQPGIEELSQLSPAIIAYQNATAAS